MLTVFYILIFLIVFIEMEQSGGSLSQGFYCFLKGIWGFWGQFFLFMVTLSLINCFWIIFIWFVSENVVAVGCLFFWAMTTKGGYFFLLFLTVLFFNLVWFWGFKFF